MDALLKYFPIIVFLSQLATAVFILWVDIRAAAKAAAAVDPVKADVAALVAQVGTIAIRLNEAESDIDGLPTKADVERVLGEAKAAHAEASAANAGINRIVGMILERGMRDR